MNFAVYRKVRKQGTDPNAGQLSLLAVTVAVECFLVFMAGFVQGCKVFGALFDGAGL